MRKEIREGIRLQIKARLMIAYGDGLRGSTCDITGAIDTLLKYLHSHGVVIKNEDVENDIMANMGVYPKALSGGEHPYEERSPYQNGWNDALMAVTKQMCEAKLETVAVESLIEEG